MMIASNDLKVKFWIVRDSKNS